MRKIVRLGSRCDQDLYHITLNPAIESFRTSCRKARKEEKWNIYVGNGERFNADFSSECSKKMFEFCARVFDNMFELCAGVFQHMLEFSVRVFEKMFEFCVRVFEKMFEFCARVFEKMFEFCFANLE
jgi:hypothetical protein